MAGWTVEHRDSGHTLVVDIVVRVEFEVDHRLVVGHKGFVAGHMLCFVPDRHPEGVDCLSTEGIPVVGIVPVDRMEDSPVGLLDCSIDLQTSMALED